MVDSIHFNRLHYLMEVKKIIKGLVDYVYIMQDVSICKL